VAVTRDIPVSLLDLEDYDHIIVSYSGGKDSLAMLLHLLDLGASKEQLELWHQHVDGDVSERGLMDWPCTTGYVKASGKHFDIRTLFQWKDGGLEGEMLRHNSKTKGVYYEGIDGKTYYLASTRGKESTRRMFPQVSANLSVRWCSAYVKIDVARRVINNDPRFQKSKTLFLTGERREESAARAKYDETPDHNCHKAKRTVHHWRPILNWTEQEVWDRIRQERIQPHPAYRLGWGRVSCMTCIFGDKHQWASVRQIDPQRFQRIADYEDEFGKTIHRDKSVAEQADSGEVFPETGQQDLVKLALSKEYPQRLFTLAENESWEQPAGAFKHCGGPT
jgi:3'-phosphoadenosine 5'-phosphosulfate sulfotransferase (PAPS reductase)/FAD synthetase